ncbi:hypothetical protein [Streptomyces sp. NPDC006638]
MSTLHYVSGLLLTLASAADALASPFVIVAARRSTAPSQQKEQ